MKQEIISYLSTIKKEMHELAKFLYDNPEESFKELKAQDYISELLSAKGFKVTKNYMDISTAFHAQFGEGHPKICFICEYDADKNGGHIYGNNLATTISVASALSLAKVITKLSGSVVVIGTPGELKGGSKVVLQKQGAFKDIDAILISKPHINNIVISLSESPLAEIKVNETLSRLFSHNLKECGIIDIETAKRVCTGSNLLSIIDTVPCINSYISIVKDKNITYPSPKFAKETLSDYAQDIALKIAQSLAFTGVDLLEKKDLLIEAKSELKAL